MDDTLSFGSGSTLLGGDAGSALSEAIARRQSGQAGVTSQVTPSSISYNPATQVPQAPQGGAQMPLPAAGGVSLPGATSLNPQQALDTSEAQIIIKALDSRLKALSKMQGG